MTMQIKNLKNQAEEKQNLEIIVKSHAHKFKQTFKLTYHSLKNLKLQKK